MNIWYWRSDNGAVQNLAAGGPGSTTMLDNQPVSGAAQYIERDGDPNEWTVVMSRPIPVTGDYEVSFRRRNRPDGLRDLAGRRGPARRAEERLRRLDPARHDGGLGAWSSEKSWPSSIAASAMPANSARRKTTCPLDKPYHNKRLIEARLEEIGQIIVVLANKGGVGKEHGDGQSRRGAGPARLPRRRGGRRYSRSEPEPVLRFRGRQDPNLSYNGLKTQGFEADGIEYPVRIGSLAFMLEDDTTPIVWRDAYKHDFIHHLIGSFEWGSLDFLIVDMPPGTGNELITLCDMLEGSNVSAVLVSTPQAVAQMDSLKAARFCVERGLPMIGAVENMAGVVCPHCSVEFHLFPDAGLGEALDAMGISRVAAVPLAPELAQGSDCGEPVVCAHPHSAAAMSFAPLVEAVAALGRADFDLAVAATLGEVFDANLADPALQEALADLPVDARAAFGDEIAALLREEAGRLREAAGESGVN